MTSLDPIWINTIGAMIPVALAVIASHFKLSNKITKIETELTNYKVKVDKLEEQSERHHAELFSEVDNISKSIQSLEKIILETSLRREHDYDRLKDLITTVTTFQNSQEKRIANIEYALYENNPVTSRKTRRKNDEN